ncbi:MAG: large subunit ribosomal protein L4 [Parcubacteria group bacterium Gr01-1014_107]|nr:MAG: large subunit ribosomal protein L4 [Parcubacteria group bacterium Gr01-1014_107]
MDAKVFSEQGEERGKVELPERIFGLPWNSDLVHQVVVSMLSRKRKGTAHVKDRGEVSGGGKKPWRQKGTGRARHGSIRSPIWVHGGITHGPNKEKNYYKKVNKKARAQALYAILSRKLKDKEILFIDSLDIPQPKSRMAKETLGKLSAIPGFEGMSEKKRNSALIALEEKKEVISKSFRNFGNVTVEEIRNLNPLTLLQYKYLVINNPEKALKKIP